MAQQKWPRRRSQRIDFPLDEEVEKGYRSEELEEEALKILREAGHIIHYLRAEKESELDRSGIDFLVWLETGLIAPLQVKSSARGRQEHLFEFGYLVPCCVVVEPSDTPVDLADKTLKELGLDIRPLHEFLIEAIQEI